MSSTSKLDTTPVTPVIQGACNKAILRLPWLSVGAILPVFRLVLLILLCLGLGLFGLITMTIKLALSTEDVFVRSIE
jgi:hypothetical protein